MFDDHIHPKLPDSLKDFGKDYSQVTPEDERLLRRYIFEPLDQLTESLTNQTSRKEKKVETIRVRALKENEFFRTEDGKSIGRKKRVQYSPAKDADLTYAEQHCYHPDDTERYASGPINPDAYVRPLHPDERVQKMTDDEIREHLSGKCGGKRVTDKERPISDQETERSYGIEN